MTSFNTWIHLIYEFIQYKYISSIVNKGYFHGHDTGATDKPFSWAANLVTLPAAHVGMDALAGLLDDSVLAATTNRTTVQQLKLANLLLKTLAVALMAANKNV